MELLRGSWMFAVGALDAYFCDAYTDIVAATLASKCRQPALVLPEFVEDIMLPARAVLAEYTNENWCWRMAARKMMARENVLTGLPVQDLFNPLLSRLNGKLSEADWQYIDKAFSLFQSRLLHGPIAALSEDSRTGGRADLTLLEALRKLFRLPE